MRAFNTTVIILVTCALAEWLLPWWSIALVAFTVSVMAALRPGKAFLTGMCGVGLWWLIAALYRDIPNHHILSTRMAELFHLPGYGFYIALTVLIGALTGGMAAAAGALVNRKR
ncbi:hypothetical protein GCM10023093_03530 [Nemorincola caseinilytica]|uniref:Transmembrane protein n=1 Tax=Nemorincola caseinilytica TaxID=2054315 RepID=A0ABP8N7K8_9BACT